MELCICDRPRNSNWQNQKVCRPCYKKLWAKSKNKTNTILKYRPEFDQYVDIIKSMAETANISEIEKTTSLYYKAIVCIAREHNIKLNSGVALKKGSKRYEKSPSLIEEGGTIKEARLLEGCDIENLNTNPLNIESPEKTKNEIHSWITSFDLNAVQNFKLPSRKELDIFIPSLNLGIEYCGLYWHSEKNGKDKNYHYDKMKEVNSQGVRLITIFEDEWLDRNSQVKNFLLSVLNKNEYKVYGRNTYVKIIEKSAANRFYEENHIQGRPHNTNLNVGLLTKKGDKLLGVMSFGPHHRGGDPHMSVLNRLAFLHNYTVYGGASKLFLFAADLLRKAGYKTIASWSDNRWSEGAVYEKLGFVLEEELKPDYSYVVEGKSRVSKQSCQKKHLLKRGAVGKTELEMSLSLGYSRIWDCGKKRWVYSL